MKNNDGQPAQWEMFSKHSGEITILKKLLGVNSGSQFIFLEFNDPIYRDRVMALINTITPGLGTIYADNKKHSAYVDFEQDLFSTFKGHQGIHVLNLDSWFNAPGGMGRIRGFNYHRENIAENCQGPLLIWLTRESVRKMALEAPDFWSWRSAVLDFTIPRDPVSGLIFDRQVDYSDEDDSSRVKRIQEIDDYLRQNKNDLSRELLINLLREQGGHFSAIGEHEKALSLFNEALSLANRVNDKQEMAFILREIASTKHAQGLGEKSVELRMEAGRIFKDLGDKHAYAYTLLEIASDLLSLKQVDDALSQYEEARKIFEALGHEQDLANVLTRIADLKNAQGLVDDAIELYLKVLEIVRKTIGDDHPEYAKYLNMLARVLEDRGQYGEAEQFLREAMEIVRKTIGPGRLEYATLLNNLALVLNAQGVYGEAETLYREALEIGRKRIGPEHPNHAIRLNNLAVVIKAQGDYGEAETLFREALDISQRRLGPDHPQTLAIQKNLDSLKEGHV